MDWRRRPGRGGALLSPSLSLSLCVSEPQRGEKARGLTASCSLVLPPLPEPYTRCGVDKPRAWPLRSRKAWLSPTLATSTRPLSCIRRKRDKVSPPLLYSISQVKVLICLPLPPTRARSPAFRLKESRGGQIGARRRIGERCRVWPRNTPAPLQKDEAEQGSAPAPSPPPLSHLDHDDRARRSCARQHVGPQLPQVLHQLLITLQGREESYRHHHARFIVCNITLGLVRRVARCAASPRRTGRG